jgi:hypothetical protein
VSDRTERQVDINEIHFVLFNSKLVFAIRIRTQRGCYSKTEAAAHSIFNAIPNGFHGFIILLTSSWVCKYQLRQRIPIVGTNELKSCLKLVR